MQEEHRREHDRETRHEIEREWREPDREIDHENGGHRRKYGQETDPKIGEHRRQQDWEDPLPDQDQKIERGNAGRDDKGKGKEKSTRRSYQPLIEEYKEILDQEDLPSASNPDNTWDDVLFIQCRSNAHEAWKIWEKNWLDRLRTNPEMSNQEEFENIFEEGLSGLLGDWYKATERDPFDRTVISKQAREIAKKIETYLNELRRADSPIKNYFERPLVLVAYEIHRELHWLDDPGASLIADYKEIVGQYGDADFHDMTKVAGKSKSLSTFWQKMKRENTDEFSSKVFNSNLSDTLDKWSKAWEAETRNFDAKEVFRLAKKIREIISKYLSRLSEVKENTDQVKQLKTSLKVVAHMVATELNIGEEMGQFDDRGEYDSNV